MNPLKITLVSASFEEQSRSRTALVVAQEHLAAIPGVEVSFVDLQELGIDAYPGPEEHPERDRAVALFEGADAHVIAVPVHNWGAAASACAFLAHALDPEDGRRFRPALLIGGAGGTRSHLALDGLVRSLLTEIDAVVVGKPIIVAGADVDKGAGKLAPAVAARIHRSLDVLVALARASATV